MMGRRDWQGQFFYAFDLDKIVPPDHLVRQIDGFSRSGLGAQPRLARLTQGGWAARHEQRVHKVERAATGLAEHPAASTLSRWMSFDSGVGC